MSREQDRRDAAAWAQEWQIRRKNRRLLIIPALIAGVVVLYLLVNFLIIQFTRTTYGSEEEMRAALQGRFETDYAEDIEITGDDVRLTYYEISHYDQDYAERYGYSEYGDSIYDDTVEKWDYRRGIIKCRWMGDIKVNKNGELVYHEYTVLKKTDEPRPEPFDPSILENGGTGEESAEFTEEEQEAAEAQQESLEETENEYQASSDLN